MMSCFRKQIAFELSVGALYPLQKADDNALQGVTECHCVNEVDGDDDDDDIEIGSPISLNSDIHSDDFLVPDFKNFGPDPDDLTALKWGRDHYIRSFPHHLLKRKESESPFTRRSIRQVVKKMEPLIRCFITGRQMSMFKNHIPYIKTLRKENPYWPLETCCDMVHEIELYLMGIQDYVGGGAMIMKHVQKCETDLIRCSGGAGSPEHRLPCVECGAVECGANFQAVLDPGLLTNHFFPLGLHYLTIKNFAIWD
eukprot:Em0010g162a